MLTAGSTAKVPAKDMLEQLLPDLITFLLTHPQVKSIKQVLCLLGAQLAVAQRSAGTARSFCKQGHFCG